MYVNIVAICKYCGHLNNNKYNNDNKEDEISKHNLGYNCEYCDKFEHFA